MKLNIDTMPYCPDDCRFLKLREDVDIDREYQPHVFYTYKHINVCKNLIDHLQKQKKLKDH